LRTGPPAQSNPYPGYCWSYDSFGNRLTQMSASVPFAAGQGGANGCSTTGNLGENVWAQYNGTTNGTNNNQMSATKPNMNQANDYDAAGNVLNDGVNAYLYDIEGRLCAVENLTVGTITQYVYDAEGTRVAKGKLSWTGSGNPTWNTACSATSGQGGWTFTLTTSWILGQGGEQVTELDAADVNLSNPSGWAHTNVFAGGALIATYDYAANNTLFALTDWLGTKRVEVGANPCATAYTSLPFGDSLTPASVSGFSACQDDATENHFTGKERDTESGNDYFGARYYSSAMGRWLSPDPGKLTMKHLANPQKWNKYNYVLNNPLTMFDPDGQAEVTIQLRAYIPQASMAGYRGDNRGPTSSQNVTSRTSITVRVETDPSKSANPLLSAPVSTAGQTQRLSDGKTDTQTVGLPTATVSRDANGNVVIHITQDAANPLSLAPQALTPGIKSDLNVTIPTDASSVSVGGTVSGSPAFELNAATGGSQVNLPLQGAPDNPAAFVGGLTQTNQVVNSAPLPPQPPPPTSCATGGTCPK
jgi:RHS repeat-associated protein